MLELSTPVYPPWNLPKKSVLKQIQRLQFWSINTYTIWDLSRQSISSKIDEMLTIASGIEPVSLLLSKSTISRKPRFPIASGTFSTRELFLTTRVRRRLEVLNKEGGILPEKLLSWRRTCWSWGKAPNHDGISPVKLLAPMLICSRRRSLDSSGAKKPMKLLELMSRD